MLGNNESAVSWGAVIAGGFAAAATSLILLMFGVGAGFTTLSPWSDTGASGVTYSHAAGIYLVVMAVIASTIGGYLAGRLRNEWADVHTDERFFRDTANGVVTWAFATVLTATALAGATTHILASASAGTIPAAGAGAAQAAQSGGPLDSYVDTLLRSDAAAPAAGTQQGDAASTRGELTRLLVPTTRRGGEMSANDRTAAARIVSARTGLSQADAEQRVTQVATQAKNAAEQARKAAARLSFWMAAAMLAGAFAAALAATEGGKLRNARWYEPGWNPRSMNVRS